MDQELDAVEKGDAQISPSTGGKSVRERGCQVGRMLWHAPGRIPFLSLRLSQAKRRLDIT